MDEFPSVKLSFTTVLFSLIRRPYLRMRQSYLSDKSLRLCKTALSLFLIALIGSIASHTLASPEDEYKVLSDQEVTGLITEWASLRPDQRRALLYEIRSRMALSGISSIQNPDEGPVEKQSISGRQYGRQNLVERPIRLSKQSLDIRVRGVRNMGPPRANNAKKHSLPGGIDSILRSRGDDKRLQVFKEGVVDYRDAQIRFGSGFESRKRVKSSAQRDKLHPQKADDR